MNPLFPINRKAAQVFAAALALALTGLAATACTPAVTPPTPTPLTGPLSRSAIAAEPGWAGLAVPTYTPDATAVATIRRQAIDVDILLFLGTWCGDCLREVPRFFTIMDEAGWGESRTTIYGLDQTMQDAEGLAARWSIEAVPTFIFLKDGRELGRIVERPRLTLEWEMAQILLSGAAAAHPASPTADSVATLTPEEVEALLAGPTPPAVFDTRSKAEYEAGHLPGALWLPFGELDTRMAEVPQDRLSIFYCSGST